VSTGRGVLSMYELYRQVREYAGSCSYQRSLLMQQKIKLSSSHRQSLSTSAAAC
jgi:hypothetical protein